MTSFAYTTGNPNNLTAGASASMNDVQGPFTDLRTFLNGANLSDTNLQNAGTGLAKLTPLVLYGGVSTAGAILFAGSGGWTSSRTSLGLYLVTWSPAFSNAPALVITPSSATGTLSWQITSATSSAANVSIFASTTGASTDANFYFVAIGTR